MQQYRLIRDHSWQKDILFLCLMLGSLFFLLLGARPLFVPDEGRYAEIAREMALSKNYITPYLNYIKYFEKPPLFYWMESFVIHAAGLKLSALRSVNACLGLLGCLITYFTASRLYDRVTGFLAAIILGTSTLYYAMLNMVNLDLTVTFFLTATCFCFLLGTQTLSSSRRFFWLASICAALAVLTKGLIGIVFPCLIVGVWILITRNWRVLRQIPFLSCIIIFLLIAAPWHILVSIKNPEFFYFYFITQHFLRYTTVSVGHYQPFWYFVPCFILGFFPWIIFFIQTISFHMTQIKRKFRNNETAIFLMIWAIIIFTFFSFSKSKLISYILPMFPPTAILTAHYLTTQLNAKKFSGIKLGYFMLIMLSLMIALTYIIFAFKTPLPHPTQAKIYLSLASIILLLTSLLSCYLIWRSSRQFLIVTIIGSYLFLCCSLAAVSYIDTRTILPLAKKLNSIIKSNDEVVTYGQYFQDLPFYLKRRVDIVGWENELKFGMQHQQVNEWILDQQSFWTKWVDTSHRVFMLVNIKTYEKMQKTYIYFPFYPIAKTQTIMLVSNQA